MSNCPAPNGTAMAKGENARSPLANARLASPAPRYQTPTASSGRGRERQEAMNPRLARQHPQGLRRKAEQHEGQERAGDARRNELLGGGTDHLVGKSRMDPARARHHLDADQDDGDGRRRHPQCHIVEDVSRRVGQPPRLQPRRKHRQEPGGGDRDRSVAAELGATRHLAADQGDVGQGLVQVLHRPICLSFALQSTPAGIAMQASRAGQVNGRRARRGSRRRASAGDRACRGPERRRRCFPGP